MKSCGVALPSWMRRKVVTWAAEATAIDPVRGIGFGLGSTLKSAEPGEVWTSPAVLIQSGWAAAAYHTQPSGSEAVIAVSTRLLPAGNWRVFTAADIGQVNS